MTLMFAPAAEMTAWLTQHLMPGAAWPSLAPRATPIYPGMPQDWIAARHLNAAELWMVRLLNWAAESLPPGADCLRPLQQACRYLTGHSDLHAAQARLEHGDDPRDHEGIGELLGALRAEMTSYRQKKAEADLKALRGQPCTRPSLPHPTTIKVPLSNWSHPDDPDHHTWLDLGALLSTPVQLPEDVSSWLNALKGAVTGYSVTPDECDSGDACDDEPGEDTGKLISAFWTAPATTSLWKPASHDEAIVSLEVARSLDVDYPISAAALRQAALKKLSRRISTRPLLCAAADLPNTLKVSPGDHSNAALRRQVNTFRDLFDVIQLRPCTLNELHQILMAYSHFDDVNETLIRLLRTSEDRRLQEHAMQARRSAWRRQLQTLLANLPEVGTFMDSLSPHRSLNTSQRSGLSLLMMALRPRDARRESPLTALNHLISRQDDASTPPTLGDLRALTKVWTDLGGSREAHTALLLRLSTWTQPSADFADLLAATSAHDPLSGGGTAVDRQITEWLMAARHAHQPETEDRQSPATHRAA